MPTGASSNTTARDGGIPTFFAATRKTSGSGLPRVMSSSEAIAAKRPSSPHSAIVSSRFGKTALEPIASRAPAPVSPSRTSRTPSISVIFPFASVL